MRVLPCPETGKRSIRGPDFHFKSPFPSTGSSRSGTSTWQTGSYFSKWRFVNDIEDIVFCVSPQTRSVFRQDPPCAPLSTVAGETRPDEGVIWIAGPSRSLKNIACDSESANHDSDDYRGKHASSLHGELLYARESNLAYTTRFIKMDNSKRPMRIDLLWKNCTFGHAISKKSGNNRLRRSGPGAARRTRNASAGPW